GGLRRSCQCTPRTLLDQHSTESFRRADEPESQDLADRSQQPGHITNPELGLPCIDGYHRRRAHLPSGTRYRQGRIHACHEDQLGDFTGRVGVCAEVLAGADLGALLQYHL
ncbi:hypothetical protein LTR16_012348, partial [Cryomyces antarcticus]